MIFAVVVIYGVTTTHEAEQSAPAPMAAEDIGLCLPSVICTTVYLPTYIPVTIRATVRVPVTIRVTEIIRPPRVTVQLPGVIRTILVPGGTRTVTAPGLPGATKTATVVVSQRIIQNGTAPPVTQEVRRTISAPGVTGQTITTRATVTTSKEVVRLPGTTRTVTIPAAVGIGLLGLIILMALVLFILWLGYVLGFKDADRKNANFLRALRDSVKRTPGKHQI